MTISNFKFSPGAQYLFGRAYTLTLGPPGGAVALQYGTISRPGTASSALKVRFDIDKTMIGASNKSKIDIFNLSAQTRQAINKGYIIQLAAGYNGLVQTLFVGSVINTKSDRAQGDIITSLECGDGESAITNAVMDKPYPSGVTLAAILTDIGAILAQKTASQPQGIAAGIAVGIPSVIYNNGFAAHGAIRDTLDILLKPQNMEWNIQNGNLNIIPLNNYNGQTAIVVSAETGMIGVPSKNEFFTQVNSLLNPNLVPGALIQLISENKPLNGFYKIRRSHIEGDTHDSKWQVGMECIPISAAAVNQTLPVASGFNYAGAVSQ